MTDLAELEQSLTESLDTLRVWWPAMLQPSSSGSVAAAPSASPTQLDDDSPSEVDTPRLERVLSLRREVVDYLAGLALVVTRDRPAAGVVRCTHGATVVLRWPRLGPTRPVCAAGRPFAGPGLHAASWRDFEDLQAFLRVHLQWFTGHELAPTAAEALASAAQRVRSLANPQRSGSVRVGDCPVRISVEGEGLVECGTPVRVRLGRGGTQLIKCRGCGTSDTLDGWVGRIVGKPQLVTAEELRALLHRRLGIRITRAGIRTWVHRGVIYASGRDDQGADLFDFREVVRALHLREELQLRDKDDAGDVETR